MSDCFYSGQRRRVWRAVLVKSKRVRKLLAGFGCRLVQNHKGHPEENAHLERSYQTDDEEFYIPRVFKIKSESDLLVEGLEYNYYYNNYRKYSALDYQRPFEYLKKQTPEIDDEIRYVVPIMLDKVAVELGPWSWIQCLGTLQNSDLF